MVQVKHVSPYMRTHQKRASVNVQTAPVQERRQAGPKLAHVDNHSPFVFVTSATTTTATATSRSSQCLVVANFHASTHGIPMHRSRVHG